MQDAANNDPKNIHEIGLRFNAGKPACELFPPAAMLELANGYGKGAEKYSPNNWRIGMRFGICVGAALRHIFKFMAGQNKDQETGVHHLALAAWNCLAIIQYQADGVGTDDRYVKITSSGPDVLYRANIKTVV